MPFEKNPDELGALWERTGSKGPFMTGTVNGVDVVVFKNTKKTNDKAPDWRVLKSKPKSEASGREMHNANAPKPSSDLDW